MSEWKAINDKSYGACVVVKGATRTSLGGSDVPVYIAHRLSSMALAESIARAHNSHDALISALERARGCMGRSVRGVPERALAETYAEIDAALALAKGESNA